MLTISCELVREGQRGFKATRCFNIARDLGQIAKGAREIDQAWHLWRAGSLVPLLESLTHVAARIFRRMTTTFLDCSIEPGS
jgi:hypothetical protein